MLWVWTFFPYKSWTFVLINLWSCTLWWQCTSTKTCEQFSIHLIPAFILLIFWKLLYEITSNSGKLNHVYLLTSTAAMTTNLVVDFCSNYYPFYIAQIGQIKFNRIRIYLFFEETKFTQLENKFLCNHSFFHTKLSSWTPIQILSFRGISVSVYIAETSVAGRVVGRES